MTIRDIQYKNLQQTDSNKIIAEGKSVSAIYGRMEGVIYTSFSVHSVYAPRFPRKVQINRELSQTEIREGID